MFDFLGCCMVREYVDDAIIEVSKQAKIDLNAAADKIHGSASKLKEKELVKSLSYDDVAQEKYDIEDASATVYVVRFAMSAAVWFYGGLPAQIALSLVLLMLPLGAGAIASLQGGDIEDEKSQHAPQDSEPAEAQDERVATLLKRFEAEEAVDETTCRRFLTARKGDVSAASEMLGNYVAWRKEVLPHKIVPADIPNELAKRKGFVHGADLSGQSIVWIFAGRHDKGDRDVDEITKLVLFNMEQAIARSEADGHQRVCVVFNLAGFGSKTMDFEVVKILIHILANYYPERLGRVILWNAPSLFTMFWRAVRPWIDPATVQRIGFVGGSLKEFIAAEQLPEDAAAASKP